MNPTWLSRRLLVPPTLLALMLLSGCGADADDAGTGVDVSDSDASTGSTTSGLSGAPTPTTSPRTNADVGTVVVNAALGVNALEAAATLPTFVEVTGADDLATTYAGVPGIEPVVAAVEERPLASGDRLFVYVVAACTTDDVALRVRGAEVAMVVSGTAALKCEPPPLQMVVWQLAPGDVPADAVPAQAIQK